MKEVPNISKKAEKTLLLCCVAGIICCGFALIPYIQELIILCAEKILHRDLTNLVWKQRMSRSALTGLNYISISFFVFLILRIRSEKYEGLLKGSLVCIFMILQLVKIRLGNSGQDEYMLTSYLVSYRYGFASRMFIGTIVDLFTMGGFISKNFIITFIFYSSVLFCFSIALVFCCLIQKSSGKTKLPITVLFLLYLFSPISPLVYFTPEFFGRMEIYALPCILLIFSFFDKDKWCFLIPILCFICLASHLVVVFFYIPAVLLVLLYNVFSNHQPKQDTKYVLLITVLVIAAASLYFILFSRSALSFQTENEFMSVLQGRTDISLDTLPDGASIRYDYFFSIGETLKFVKDHMDIYKQDGIFFGFYTIFQTIPLFFLFILFWISCIKLESEKQIKIVFLCSALLPILSVPAFILFLDYGRWLTMIFTAQFMLVFYFLYKQENSVVLTAQKIVTIIRNHYYAAISLIFISLFMGYPRCVSPSENFQSLLALIVRTLKSL